MESIWQPAERRRNTPYNASAAEIGLNYGARGKKAGVPQIPDESCILRGLMAQRKRGETGLLASNDTPQSILIATGVTVIQRTSVLPGSRQCILVATAWAIAIRRLLLPIFEIVRKGHFVSLSH
jgi:hypothetical protein